MNVCNGDADGLCAAVQWRLHTSASVVLYTGLRRDIEASRGDEVCVFDLSISYRPHTALDDVADGQLLCDCCNICLLVTKRERRRAGYHEKARDTSQQGDDVLDKDLIVRKNVERQHGNRRLGGGWNR